MTAAGAERRGKEDTFFLEEEVLPSQSLRRKFWDWRRLGSLLQPFPLSSDWGFYTRKAKRKAAP